MLMADIQSGVVTDLMILWTHLKTHVNLEANMWPLNNSKPLKQTAKYDAWNSSPHTLQGAIS